MGKFINVLIVDDHSVFREGVVKIISSVPEVRYCDEAENGKIALDKLAQDHFDIVILDIYMPVMDGLEASHLIKEHYPKIKIIIFSMFSEKLQVVQLIEMGIDAYILKSAYKDEIIKALNYVASDTKYFTTEVDEIWENYLDTRTNGQTEGNEQPHFSQREREIIKLLCQGLKAKEISEIIFVSYNTVCSHRAHVMKKMKVKNIAGLMNYARNNHLVIT